MKNASRRNPQRQWATVFTFLTVLVILLLVLNCNGLASVFPVDNHFWKDVKNNINVMMDEAVSKMMGTDAENLLEKISSENRGDRLKAMQTISQSTSRQTVTHVIPALIDTMLHDEAEMVRIEAAQTLNLLGATAYDAKPAMLQSLGDESGDIRSLAVGFLVKLGSEVRQELLHELDTTDAKRYAASALALSHFKTEQHRGLLPRLMALSKHSDNTVRAHAVSALGNFRDPSASETLRCSLHDSDAHVRTSAAVAVEQVLNEPQQLLEMIRPLLQDDCPEVRRNVVQIMGRLQGNEAALSLITHHLKEENDPATNELTCRIKERLECLMPRNSRH